MPIEYVPEIPLMRPIIDYDNRGYWESLQRHELAIQRCKNCGLRVHPPRPMCPRCLSTDKEWVPSSGRGVVHTWVTFFYEKSAYPGIKVPYSVAVVELDEDGLRITANLVDLKPDEIYIGMPVEAVFVDVDEKLSLVHFRKRESR
ncbi:Zn-ribbon domain-containing OB-fold protein [Chloroflexota bacterium]